MKTPIKMLEDIASEIQENTSLLVFIVRNAQDLGSEPDNALACLIRAMLKTSEKADEYINILANSGVTHE